MDKEKIIQLNRYIIPLSALLLFVDASVFTIFGSNILYSLLCFYTLILFFQPKIAPLVLIGIILPLESFAYSHNVFLFFVIITLLSFMAKWAQKMLSRTSFLPYLFVLLFITTEQLVIEPHIDINVQKNYTIYKICVNLLMLVIFLKYFTKGKLGDRL